MSEISDLADSIYSSEFDSSSEAANLTSIQAWLEENLGLLNTLINTSYNGVDPGMGLEEKAIYKQIYLYNYYSKQSRNVLRGIVSSTSSDNVLMVADGDNRIQFANKNEIGKTFLQVGGIEAGAVEEDEDLPAVVEGGGILMPEGILDGGLDN
jgi:hypothetical protein